MLLEKSTAVAWWRKRDQPKIYIERQCGISTVAAGMCIVGGGTFAHTHKHKHKLAHKQYGVLTGILRLSLFDGDSSFLRFFFLLLAIPLSLALFALGSLTLAVLLASMFVRLQQ